MNESIIIDGKQIGGAAPVYIIAEMSGNHLHSYDNAVRLIREAKRAGADAVKLQTYTADTITIDSDNEYFRITQGTIWDGTTLHKLYEEAYTPYEWHQGLFDIAKGEDITIFSSPFDKSAVDFLERLDVPAYKIASFEITDIPLLKHVASKRKPIIISTGIARLSDIEEAMCAFKSEGNTDIVILKCSSAYPTPMEDINLKTIPNIRETFGVIPGLSDHTLGHVTALGAVALGAKVIEKHLTLDRNAGGPDAVFSMEPHEFKSMVDDVRTLEKALGTVNYELSEKQTGSREHSRSLFVTRDMSAGEAFTEENIRSVRPGFGMHTRHYGEILGAKARVDIKKGTPLKWELISR